MKWEKNAHFEPLKCIFMWIKHGKKSIGKRAIIGFDHGLRPRFLSTESLGPCFFHTAQETMIKSYSLCYERIPCSSHPRATFLYELALQVVATSFKEGVHCVSRFFQINIMSFRWVQYVHMVGKGFQYTCRTRGPTPSHGVMLQTI